MDDYQYYIYIMASLSGVLYIGVTNDLERRVYEHKSGINKGFTKKYRIKRLIYYEEYSNIEEAIEREKQLKNWRRNKKTNLIAKMNPLWKDLSNEWGDWQSKYKGEVKDPYE